MAFESEALQPEHRKAATPLTAPHTHVLQGIATPQVTQLVPASPSAPHSRHVDPSSVGAADVR